jgi:hypothetical protein
MSRSLEAINRRSETGAAEVIPWVEWLARLGYVAKGIVYFVVGALAAQAAFGNGGETTGQQGALVEILHQPYGRILLGVVAVGLFGYALWRFVEAGLDPERKGKDAKGLIQRAGYVASGLAYSALGIEAVRLVLGLGGGEGGNRYEDWTAQLMAQPLGRWLVGLAGLVVIGVGLWQFYEAYSAHFRKELLLNQLNDQQRGWVIGSGRFGFAARGVVYALIGGFLLQAALQADPNEAGGLGDALAVLAQQPYGPWVLGAVAGGLMAYGLFAVVLARYRRIFVPV